MLRFHFALLACGDVPTLLPTAMQLENYMQPPKPDLNTFCLGHKSSQKLGIQ